MDINSVLFEVRVTVDNLTEVVRPGDIILGAEDLGPVESVRLTRDGNSNALVVGAKGRDVLGLPSTVEIFRLNA